MQKNSLLTNNKWVQSPLSKDVEKILSNLDLRYYQRGTGRATLDLKKVIDKHRQWVSQIINLENFKFAYITSGATEAINHWRLTDSRPWQYYKGDYQYPQMLSKNGSEVTVLNSTDVLYISNPQCYNGNFEDFSNIQNPVILDCAYIGATPIKKINLPNNTEQVIFSFSKGWGLVGQRCGIVYTKKPHPTLHPLKKVECFNYSTAPIMDAIMSNFEIDSMYKRYVSQQKKISKKYNFTPSDTYFICTTTDEYYSALRRKDDCARVCITPLLENYRLQ